MKVIYEKTILEKIESEIYEAKMKNKAIEKIIVDEEEWEALAKEMSVRLLPYKMYVNETSSKDTFCTVMGVVVEREAVVSPSPPSEGWYGLVVSGSWGAATKFFEKYLELFSNNVKHQDSNRLIIKLKSGETYRFFAKEGDWSVLLKGSYDSIFVSPDLLMSAEELSKIHVLRKKL